MKKNRPKISIILPVYNDEKYIKESLDSILNQTFNDFELIIINDNSKDDTMKIIKNYTKIESKIKIINNKKNIGVYRSINKGLKKAKGNYIARMDSDDICYKNRLQTQYDFLEKNKDIFLIGTSAFIIDKNGKKIKHLMKYQIFPFLMKIILKRRNCIIHPSIMFRNTGELYSEKKNEQDEWLFYKSLLEKKKKIINLPNTLLKYRINPKGMSAKDGLYEGTKYEKYL
ncbi:MAG TPA: glycosyltransferase family A protein [archaeon]|nr:glycosyltransferase family A protein [archaeon]